MITPESDAFLVVIEFNTPAHKKRTNSRTVKKTLSTLEWMNEAAIAMDLNFSQVLQEALLSKDTALEDLQAGLTVYPTFPGRKYSHRDGGYQSVFHSKTT